MAAAVRVLLVEDNAADAAEVSDMLLFAPAPGFAVTWAKRVSEAADLLAADPFDVVLLDLGLPDAEGLGGLAALRARAPSVAIIVLSGKRDHEVALEALEAGAQDYLVKGRIDDETLQRSIRYALTRREAEKSAWHLAAIIESSDDAIIGKDLDGRITSWNPGAERLYGYRAEEAIGLPIWTLMHEERAPEEFQVLERVFKGERVSSFETERMRRDGSAVEVSLTISPIVDAAGTVVGASTIARNISDRKRLERELRYHADHDHLTRLLNRRRFEEELARHLALAARHGPSGALLAVDLDGLKEVNDGHGHHTGDELLKGTAEGLRGRLRETDVVARMGGDEFAVLLPRASAKEACAVAADLLRVVRELELLVAGLVLRQTASIGVAPVDSVPVTTQDLMRRADQALYRAKQAGRDRFEVSEGASVA